MKGTDIFKQTISEYLDIREQIDPQFATMRRKVNRSIDDIVTYILNQVKASGCNGFDDDEIYGMAIHAAEEKDLEIGDTINSQVKINHHVELTEEEKAEQRQIALKRFQEDEYRKIKERNQKKAQKQTSDIEQPTLFDF